MLQKGNAERSRPRRQGQRSKGHLDKFKSVGAEKMKRKASQRE